jgi:hypothetical protein
MMVYPDQAAIGLFARDLIIVVEDVPMIISVSAGSTATVVTLPAWGFAALDGSGYVNKLQLPITRKRALDALKANVTVGNATWLSFVEQGMVDHSDTQDSINIAYYNGFWEDNSPIWAFVQATLVDALGAFSNAQLEALKDQARNMP